MKLNYTIKKDVTIKFKDKTFKFPMILLSLLSIMKRRVTLKLDNVLLITGKVGSGKSTLAKGIAGVYEMLFNRELNIDNFTWNSQGIIDFTNVQENKTKVIVQDEGIQGMTGRDGITKTGHQLKITLVTKRRMNIFYIILIDELHEYNQKVINRATLLMDTRFIMRKGDPVRGFFKIYNQHEIKQVYSLLKDKKIRSIEEYKGHSKPFYTFSNYEDIFFSEEDYENEKIKQTQQNIDDGKISWTNEKMKAFYLWASTKKSYIDIGIIVGVHENTIGNWVRKEFKNFAHNT